MTKKFALIGSRRLSSTDSKTLFITGFLLAAAGCQGRSGGAPGCDTSFELGMAYYEKMKKADPTLPGKLSDQLLEVYLPSYRFANRTADRQRFIDATKLGRYQEALAMAEKFHGGWEYLGEYPRKLMARNCNQALGRDLDDPVDKVICYTPDGAMTSTTRDTGGTGQAIRIAIDRGIPVDNLGDPAVRARYENRIEANKERFARWVDLDTIYETACREAVAGFGITESNLLLDENLTKHEVLIHGSNCKHKMGKGFAKQLVERFPEVLAADAQTPQNRSKLGTYSSVTVSVQGKPLTIVNAYTQFAPASWAQQQSGELVADYDAIRKVMKAIRKDFGGQNIAMTKIGAGLANGCWLTIANLIGESLDPARVSVYDLPGPKLEAKPAPAQSQFNLL